MRHTAQPAPKPACGARTAALAAIIWAPSMPSRALRTAAHAEELGEHAEHSTVHMNSLHGHLLGVRITVHDAREGSWRPPGFADCPGLKAVLFATPGARRRSA